MRCIAILLLALSSSLAAQTVDPANHIWLLDGTTASSPSGGGGAVAFSDITAGTSAAALVVGTGGTLLTSDGGRISSTDSVEMVRKDSPGTIDPCDVVYQSGHNSGTGFILVELADADAAGKNPALGIAAETITNTVEGTIITGGKFPTTCDTSAFTAGDHFYLSTTAGAFSAQPSGAVSCVQNLGIVARSHASLGEMTMASILRCNATPNLDSGTFFLGSVGNLSVPVTMSGGATMDNVGAVTLAPGGADTQVQFNNAGAFDGDADFIWDDTLKIFSLGLATDGQIRFPTGGYSGTLPTLAWPGTSGSTWDTGFFEVNSANLGFMLKGSVRWDWINDEFRGEATNAPSILNETATSTNPTVAPARSDVDTGLCWPGADLLGLCAGAVLGFQLTEAGAAITAVNLFGPLITDSNAANSAAISTFENTAGDFQIFRVDVDPEASQTGSTGDLAIDSTNGTLHFKRSGSATNTGWQSVAGIPTYKSYTFHARDAASGENFSAGFYDYPTTDVTLTIGGSVTQTHGGANAPYAAHAFAVASGAGGTDLVLTVSGTSINDAGTRTTSDTEIIVADADTASVDDYFETTKKWLGTITYTLTGAAGAFTFNYGFAKYEDFGNNDFMVTDFESVGLANANDAGFNIELLHHASTGWTYAASGFQAGNAVLASMNTIHSTEQDLDAGEPFAFKRSGLSQAVAGGNGEGVIIRVTTATNNAVSYMDSHVGVVIR